MSPHGWALLSSASLPAAWPHQETVLWSHFILTLAISILWERLREEPKLREGK